MDSKERLWNRLEKTGRIERYYREYDKKNYSIYLIAGIIKAVPYDGSDNLIMTIDTFLHLWNDGHNDDTILEKNYKW